MEEYPMLHFKKKPLSLPKKTAKLPFGMVLPSILLSLFLPAGFVQAADTTQGRSVVTGYTMSDYIGESQNLASNGSQWTVDPKTGYYYIDPATGIQDTSKVNPKVRVYVGDKEAWRVADNESKSSLREGCSRVVQGLS
jgi:hypothetical protein